jgi:ABC-type uncharacterized transport system ATPase subunit
MIILQDASLYMIVGMAIAIVVTGRGIDLSLGPEETRNTLALIRRLRAQGIAVILINLEHVFAVAERVMVMRGGRHAGAVGPPRPATATSSA